VLGKPACLVAPDFLHPVVATAAVAVVFVAETVLLVVILVVAFGEPELCERNDLGGDELSELFRDGSLGGFGDRVWCN
jgi:hypothetical protein